MSHQQAHAMPRRGVSILEFVGCMSAMIGGVFLGSMYLGVDVKEMAYSVLEQAHVVDPRPAAAKDAVAAPTVTVPGAAGPSSPAATQPTSEIHAVETPAAAPPAAGRPASPIEPAPAATPPTDEPIPPAPPTGFFTRPELLTDAQHHALTLEYWDALGVCMQNEVKNRVPAIDSEGNWQLFDYLTGRKEGHLKAAEAITKLDARGVDDHVMAYAIKARDWHADGAGLFGRALDLLTDAPTAQLSGPFAQSWQSAATQHRMEERLLAEKYQAVQSYLSNAYPPATPAPSPQPPAK
jgi:hypothetical protein